MSAVGRRLRLAEHDGCRYLTYWCQGCEEPHTVRVKQPGDARGWEWDGDTDQPTFSPSVLVTSGHYASGWDPGKGCWCRPPPDGDSWGFSCQRCHTFVRDGMVEFLGDCSHSLAGYILPLPELPDYLWN